MKQGGSVSCQERTVRCSFSTVVVVVDLVVTRRPFTVCKGDSQDLQHCGVVSRIVDRFFIDASVIANRLTQHVNLYNIIKLIVDISLRTKATLFRPEHCILTGL